MASVGRLTTAQRIAIAAGATIRQTWDIQVPFSATHSLYFTVPIDAGIFSIDEVVAWELVTNRIIKAGSRKHVVFNPSPNVKATPKAVTYSFVVDNSDGHFYEGHPNSFYNIYETYLAVPQECLIVHKIFVAINSSDGVTWSELEHMRFTGRIKELRHEDTADGKGDIIGAKTTITCEQVGAWDALRRLWTIDDSTDVAMVNGATSYDWTVT